MLAKVSGKAVLHTDIEGGQKLLLGGWAAHHTSMQYESTLFWNTTYGSHETDIL